MMTQKKHQYIEGVLKIHNKGKGYLLNNQDNEVVGEVIDDIFSMNKKINLVLEKQNIKYLKILRLIILIL